MFNLRAITRFLPPFDQPAPDVTRIFGPSSGPNPMPNLKLSDP